MKKKFIDGDGRIFGKVSIVDIFVLLVIIAVLAAAYVKLNVKELTAPAAKTVPMEYVISLRGAHPDNAATLRVGDEVWTEIGGYAGRVIAVDIRPAMKEELTVGGKYVMGSIEGRLDVDIYLLADCTISNGRFYLDRTFEVNVNREEKLVTKYQKWTGVISAVISVDGAPFGADAE
jgi:hypothetical protein